MNIRILHFCFLICLLSFQLQTFAQLQSFQQEIVYELLENGDALWTDYFTLTQTVARGNVLISEKKYYPKLGPDHLIFCRFRIADNVYGKYTLQQGDTIAFAITKNGLKDGLCWEKKNGNLPIVFQQYHNGLVVCDSIRNFDYTIDSINHRYTQRLQGISNNQCYYNNVGKHVSTNINTDFPVSILDYDSTGKLSGDYRLFYSDGKLKEYGKYEQGLRIGFWDFYWPNGQLKEKTTYLPKPTFFLYHLIDIETFDSSGNLVLEVKNALDSQHNYYQTTKKYGYVNNVCVDSNYNLRKNQHAFDGIWISEKRHSNEKNDTSIYKDGELKYQVRYRGNSIYRTVQPDPKNQTVEEFVYYDSIGGPIAYYAVNTCCAKYISEEAEYYRNGQIKYVSRNKKMRFTEYYPNGNISYERQQNRYFKRGDTKWRRWYFYNGNLKEYEKKGHSKNYYRYNKPDTNIEYHQDGTVAMRGSIGEDERRIGTWYYYHQNNDKPNRIERYDYGKLIEKIVYDTKGLSSHEKYDSDDTWIWNRSDDGSRIDLMSKTEDSTIRTHIFNGDTTSQSYYDNIERTGFVKHKQGSIIYEKIESDDSWSLIFNPENYRICTRKNLKGLVESKSIVNSSFDHQQFISDLYRFDSITNDTIAFAVLDAASSKHLEIFEKDGSINEYLWYKRYDIDGNIINEYYADLSQELIASAFANTLYIKQNKTSHERSTVVRGIGASVGNYQDRVKIGTWRHYYDSIGGSIQAIVRFPENRGEDKTFITFYNQTGKPMTVIPRYNSSMTILSANTIQVDALRQVEVIDANGNWDLKVFNSEGKLIESTHYRKGIFSKNLTYGLD